RDPWASCRSRAAQLHVESGAKFCPRRAIAERCIGATSVNSGAEASPMIWLPVLGELDRWHDAGVTARLWLRDDDAVQPSPLLDELGELTERFRVPVTLAVIPATTGEALVQYLCGVPHMSPAIHGWAHANHAPAGEKKQEIGRHRERAVVLRELTD